MKLKEKKPNQAVLDRIKTAKKKRTVAVVPQLDNKSKPVNKDMSSLLRSTKLIERILNQNSFGDIMQG
jgi:hypothetical protein